MDVFIGATRTVRDVGSGFASVETSEDVRLASIAAVEGAEKLGEDALDLGRLADEASNPDVAAAAEENAFVLVAVSENFIAVVDAAIADDANQAEAATSEMQDLAGSWFEAAADVAVLVDDSCPEVQRRVDEELASLGVAIDSRDQTSSQATSGVSDGAIFWCADEYRMALVADAADVLGLASFDDSAVARLRGLLEDGEPGLSNEYISTFNDDFETWESEPEFEGEWNRACAAAFEAR